MISDCVKLRENKKTRINRKKSVDFTNYISPILKRGYWKKLVSGPRFWCTNQNVECTRIKWKYYLVMNKHVLKREKCWVDSWWIILIEKIYIVAIRMLSPAIHSNPARRCCVMACWNTSILSYDSRFISLHLCLVEVRNSSINTVLGSSFFSIFKKLFISADLKNWIQNLPLWSYQLIRKAKKFFSIKVCLTKRLEKT